MRNVERGTRTEAGAASAVALAGLVVSAVCLPSSAFAQSSLTVGVRPACPEAARACVETRLERDVNRYRFDALGRFAGAGGGWRYVATQAFGSDAFEVFGGRLTFRDEWRLDARVGRRVGGGRGGGGAEVGLVTRTVRFPQSRVLGHEAQAFAAFVPARGAALEARAGLVLDVRPGALGSGGAGRTPPVRRDGGPGGAVAGALERAVGDFALTVRGRYGAAFLAARRARDAGLEAVLERTGGPARLRLRARYGAARRDAYQAASFLNRDAATFDESIEATTSDTLDAAVALDVPVVGVLRFTGLLDAGLAGRRVRTRRVAAGALAFDTDFSRQALATEVALVAERPGAEGRLAVRFGGTRERRLLANRDALPPVQAAQKADLLEQADYDRGDLALVAHARASRGRLAAFADAEASLLRLDTPERNPDDRDEARQAANAGLEWRVRDGLAFSAEAFGAQTHTVYLRSARSAENQRQRTLRFRPAATFAPSIRTRVRFVSEVRATYTRDDFTLAGRTANDASARELRYELQAEHAFDARLRLDLAATHSDLRLGRLVAGRFAEIPTDTVQTQALRALVTAGARARYGVGVRLFRRSDFDRALTVRYGEGEAETSVTRPGRSVLRQLGPVATLYVPLGGGSAVRVDGWYARQRVLYRLRGALPEADADAIRAAARRGTARLLPNAAFTVVWRL